MIEKLIDRVFKARNAAHARHWTTDSYAQHEALGDFYDDVIEALDKYVESHQGVFGQLKKAPQEVPDVAELLRDDILWLTENRSGVSAGVPMLENIIDEMTAVYTRALFKIENLR